MMNALTWDGTEPVSRDHILRRVKLTTTRFGNHIWLMPSLPKVMTTLDLSSMIELLTNTSIVDESSQERPFHIFDTKYGTLALSILLFFTFMTYTVYSWYYINPCVSLYCSCTSGPDKPILYRKEVLVPYTVQYKS